MKQSMALIVGAAVFFLVATFYGYRLLTANVDVPAATPDCEQRRVLAGEPLTANLVTVDVYNASRTAGLADRISRQLQTRNFLPGTVGNNRTDMKTNDVLVVAEDGKDPRVRLVATQFNAPVKITEGAVQGSTGVAVLVGKNYAEKDLRKNAQPSLKSDREITACIPKAPEV